MCMCVYVQGLNISLQRTLYGACISEKLEIPFPSPASGQVKGGGGVSMRILN